jgi:hypothetical protein
MQPSEIEAVKAIPPIKTLQSAKIRIPVQIEPDRSCMRKTSQARAINQLFLYRRIEPL